MADTEDTTVYVGIAASAGGLEAASILVRNLPRDAHAVYVLAQHMSPTHKSLLSALISRETNLPVQELKQGADITPEIDTIYVTPPNSDVAFRDGKLGLRDPSGLPATPKPSADRLFKSLAREFGDRSVGIVLSGTGSDGSYGVQAIREAGGITIAQDTASAKYDGMPTSAIETGCIDLTLTPEQMGQHLEKILATPRDFNELRVINERPSRLSELLQILGARSRVDFRDYKETTINRRISRRMVALGIEDYQEYVDFCRTSMDEVDALFRDLLISVTRFFRDPEQFAQLEQEIRRIVNKHETGPIRVWVAGCATGEEAYSLAVLFAEALGGLKELTKSRLQIFATDIDERALDVARRGIYPVTGAHDIPVRYREQYFHISEAGLEVAPELRHVTLFSKHNIFQDPPFINLDLITLRNVLIYFNTSLQERVLARAHYALNANGVLFLGTSETVGAMSMQFETVNGADRIFTKRGVVRQSSAHMSLMAGNPQSSMAGVSALRQQDRERLDIRLFDSLAKAVAPNGFIANRNNEIVRVLGDISPILQLDERSALTLSTRLLRGGLKDEAASLVTMSLKARELREGRWQELQGMGFNQVRMIAYPMVNPQGEDHCLVAVQTRMEPVTSTDVDSLSDKERTQYILQIETEMQSTREALQQTVEELQTSNEELQSVNEELQSTNEEAQATNEELETSNEELQSTNEELITVNEELQVNASELQKVSSELSAVLDSAPYPMLVLDQALMVRRTSEQAVEFFNLKKIASIGPHLSQLSLPPEFPNFTTIASEVFKVREIRVVEVQRGDEMHKLIFSPFVDSMDQVIGVTIAIIAFDVSIQSRALEVLEQMGDSGHFRIDVARQTAYISPAMRRTFFVKSADEAGQMSYASFLQLLHPGDRDMVQRKIATALENRRAFRFEARLRRASGSLVHMLVSGSVLENEEDGAPEIVVGAARDISTEINAHLLMRNLEHLQTDLQISMFNYDVDNRAMFFTSDIFGEFDTSGESTTLETAFTSFSKPDRAAILEQIESAAESGEPFEFEGEVAMGAGDTLPVVITGLSRKRNDGSVSHVFGSVRLLNAA
ncbi:MAG: chemotaxis protein CheB [Pseudomonadota bacterium]